MIDRSSNPDRPKPAPLMPVESYAKILARPALLLVTLAGIAFWQFKPKAEAPKVSAPVPVVAKVEEPEVAPPDPPKPNPRPKREPRPTSPPPQIDKAAVAEAEASLDQATRERARAESRLADAEHALQAATLQAAKDQAESRSIGSRVKDPTARIAAATSRGGFLKGERDKLKNELAALERIPQTKSKALMARSAVAKPTDGTEFHFQIRDNRVAFIDLDRLVDMVKTDAKIRLRSGTRGRLSAMVGPVGAFSLRYELGRAAPNGLADMVESRETTYNLVGWEIVADPGSYGDTFETSRSPSSSYGRAIRQLTPGRDTVTMWIYPDGFPLYRKLRDELHARGFLVAARPLPEGTSIRGSPSGSVSAGQ
jgi:hypothetical protein